MPWNKVMSKYKAGTLHSGSKKGPAVKSHAQAVAIMLSEKRAAEGGNAEYQARGELDEAKRKKMRKQLHVESRG